MTAIAVVQARMGSSRLPGKALHPIAGRPMLAQVLDRARQVPGVAGVVLATSASDRDAPLVDLARAAGLQVCRGDEHDVLGRFMLVALATDAAFFVRVTGDCPLFCPAVAGRVLAVARAEPWWDLVTNDTTQSGYPDGTDVEIFTRHALARAIMLATSAGDREHVTPWMRRHLPHRVVRSLEDHRDLKLSVDCQADLEYVRRVYGCLSNGDPTLKATLAAVAALGRTAVEVSA